MTTKFFDSIILILWDKSSTKRVLSCKKTIRTWDVDINNIVVSKLIERKNNSKYLILHLNEVIRPLVLILPGISGYIKNFKKKNNKLTSLHIDNEKISEKYKTISIMTEDLKNIELNALPVFDSRNMKTEMRANDDKVYTNFLHGLNVPEDSVEFESFTIIFTDSSLAY